MEQRTQAPASPEVCDPEMEYGYQLWEKTPDDTAMVATTHVETQDPAGKPQLLETVAPVAE